MELDEAILEGSCTSICATLSLLLTFSSGLSGRPRGNESTYSGGGAAFTD